MARTAGQQHDDGNKPIFTTQNKSISSILELALEEALGLEGAREFVHMGRMCSILSSLARLSTSKLVARFQTKENYLKQVIEKKVSASTYHQIMSSTYLELCSELETYFRGEVPSEHINEIVFDCLPDLIIDGMVIKTQNGRYYCTPSGLKIGAQYQTSLEQNGGVVK